MKILEMAESPLVELRYLNAGRGAGQFTEDPLPVHVARVDRLPRGVSAVVAAADLQGRERFRDSPGGPLRLLGEALPERLLHEVLPLAGVGKGEPVGAILAGDLYTVPALDARGGTGDVTPVWRAFSAAFEWVAGVAGNHDTFGDPPQKRPKLFGNSHLLDGDVVEVGGLKIAGLGGIIGRPSRPNRRTEEDYVAVLENLILQSPDLLITHEGPCGTHADQRGLERLRGTVAGSGIGLLIRGHKHWETPVAELPCGLQILNVDARVVILTA